MTNKLISQAFDQGSDSLFKISLAQWSLYRSFFGSALSGGFDAFHDALQTDPDSVLQGEFNPLDFPRIARVEFGITAVEYVNVFFYGRASDKAYLSELKKRADSEGVRNLLIMCDFEEAIGSPATDKRLSAIERHKKWIEAAALLGCHSIRVNALSQGTSEEQQNLLADGLHKLAEFGDQHEINVLVENHGGLSSDGDWLVGLIKLVNHPRLGILPDFDNFQISEDVEYDRYRGVAKLMPYAQAVSAKSETFNKAGDETRTDFKRMMGIVLDADYHGYVGIEYVGRDLSEFQGIHATKALLERVREELADQ